MPKKVAGPETPLSTELDVVIVGAGFAGMYMLHRARNLGLETRAFEVGDGVGGTWYWNRYPGARCDVESMQYSYQFDEDLQQEWNWTERYSGQPEILRYANHVADRFGLRDSIQFETRVDSAHFDEADARWVVSTDRGDVVRARFLITATGCLSSATQPEIPGLETFEGEVHHTARWPKEGVDFAGKRAGVLGTGSSGIQAIPIIASESDHLTVFQRTPQFAVPARNHPLAAETVAETKANYRAFREHNSQQGLAFSLQLPPNEESALEVDEEVRRKEYEARWELGGFALFQSFGDILLDANANETVANFVKRKIREVVNDPETADALTPDTAFACKRLCLDTNYFETYNRPNVELVDLRKTPIERVTPTGIEAGGEVYPLDVLVFATGFDAMTGSLLAMDIRGRDGLRLGDKWAAGPRTYLGLGVPGFPNLFTISGPGSPSVLTNMIVSIEQHVNWITDCLASMGEQGHRTIEATPEAEEEWVDHVNTVAGETLYPTCNSWYLGANVPGKTRVFMPLVGYPPYVEKCEEVAAKGYEGFALA
jgi:cation diffusion facilitator CzcD-associated flavoprotein CzcO